MERRGAPPATGHTGVGAGRPKLGRPAARAAVLAVIVAALVVAASASGAFAAGISTASTASPTAANEPFTLFQGLSEGSIVPTAIVDVQPYSRELTPDEIDALHAKDPDTKIIRYVDNSEAIDTATDLTDPRTWSLDYARRLNTDSEWNNIWTNHQSWFLKDSQGQYINRPISNAYEMNPKRAYLMDPGSTGWRDFLVNKVSQRLSDGYDGVFLDQCSPTPTGYSAIPAKYAGDYGLWRNDINGLIDYIKSSFPTALVITNSIWQGKNYYANNAPNPIDANTEDGTEIEGFINANGNGPTESEADWLKEVMIVKRLGDEGKVVLARTAISASSTNSPRQLLAYSLATFLLGKSGSSAYFTFWSAKAEAGFNNDYVNSVYELPLGDPIGGYYQKGIAYRRDFAGGKVIVNPNDAGKSYTFTPLATNHYEDQDGKVYDSGHPLTLPAKAGVILIAVTAPPAVTAVTPKNGSTLGGDPVVITGENLTGASKVTFGGADSAEFNVDSPTQITATTPAHASGTVQVQVSTSAGASSDTAADDFTYTTPSAFTRYEQTDTNIVKTGTWANYSKTLASGGGYGRSSTAGASATIYFNGTQLDWIAMKGTTTGKADVYLDGVKKATVDLYSSSPSYDVDVWSTGGLAPGEHSVKIVWSSSNASGKYITLDAVDIAGTISAPLARYEQSSTKIVTTGLWSNYTKSAASGGSYGRSNSDDATAAITFSGTRLDWIAMKGTTTGIADVYLDGDKVTTIDLSASNPVYQVRVWSTGTLSNGVHTVRIQFNADSPSGKYLTLDAVEVWGALQ